MRQTILDLAAALHGLRREKVVDLGVAHRELAVHFALTQPLNQNLVAHLLTVFRIGETFALDRLAKLVGR